MSGSSGTRGPPFRPSGSLARLARRGGGRMRGETRVSAPEVGRLEPVALDEIVELAAVLSRLLRRRRRVPPVAAQDVDQVLPLEAAPRVVERRKRSGWGGAGGRQPEAIRLAGPCGVESSNEALVLEKEILRADLLAAREHQRLLDAVLELADVARPRVREDLLCRAAAEPLHGPP